MKRLLGFQRYIVGISSGCIFCIGISPFGSKGLFKEDKMKNNFKIILAAIDLSLHALSGGYNIPGKEDSM